MITHKHLRQLGFEKIVGKKWIHSHTGIVCNGVPYWYLRKLVSSSKQLELGFRCDIVRNYGYCYETIGGEEKYVWSISIELPFTPICSRFVSVSCDSYLQFVHYEDDLINEKQLKLDL